ncbi:hypothetical protein K469DRAFT_703536 [Zopfia rhizophila CBS 207.26]|uniref:F-box domain-containing protein n=1 Tax=Zopfia rhizophila CBS 207.26 TaxID=1314779 RepID=A0A6A6EAK2_9PEZI|nr:hypothetical protein K469DRAFT_703536 [Zopfia rhizophila CBS 207.26]
MNADALLIHIGEVLQSMGSYSPSTVSSAISRDNSPTAHDEDTVPDHARQKAMDAAEKNQSAAFLRLPVDIFKCVTDYLDRDAAWYLKQSCRGLYKSKVVDELLYRHPLQLNDVRDIRLDDWKTRHHCRWTKFQECINNTNRSYVQKLAISHWCSIADFQWIEANLPNLTSLDLTAIKDFVWTPEQTWTWKQLAEACPKLFGRIQELEVANWADYTAHSRIEYSYSYNDYRFKQRFRISRRRDGGSIAKMIFPLCTQLKVLGIRERYSGFHSWNEWEVHQRVCALVDGIVDHTASTLKTLRVHDIAPYRALFATDVSVWKNISNIEIGIYSWMEDRRDRDLIGTMRYRITPGAHHRDEEEAFDDKSYDTCDRNHLQLGQHVAQGVGVTFETLLQNLHDITHKYPNVRIKPIGKLRDVVLPPFHLVDVTQRRNRVQPQPQTVLPDSIPSQEIQDALRWLAEKCDWTPILAWDSMLCDVFPDNLDTSLPLIPKADILSRIQTRVHTMRSLNIPVRISIGNRTNGRPSSGYDGGLYFGDYKTFRGEDENRTEILAPTQARFNLTGIAHLVDELTIQYPTDIPGVVGWSRNSRRPTDGEKELLRREMKGWRRFWARYALQFKNLKKLTTIVPNDIYNDWGESELLGKLLGDESWQMLEVDSRCSPCLNCFDSWVHFGFRSYSWAKKRPRRKFVQRIFFRQDGKELQLDAPALTEEQEREEDEISEEAITTNEQRPSHRFWLVKAPKAEKRKAGDDGEEQAMTKKAREEVSASAGANLACKFS